MKLSYIPLTQYKYELTEDFTVQTEVYGLIVSHKFFTLTEDGLLVIKKGYKWDGVSDPMYDSANSMIGGLVHDAFYQMIRLGLINRLYKSIVDDEMKRLFKLCGMNPFRAGYAHLAVDLFGDSSCVVGDVKIPDTITLTY